MLYFLTVNCYEDIINALKTNSVDYQEIDHDPIYTTQESSNITGLSLEEGAKCLLLKTKDNFILVVLAGGNKLDSKKLKKALGIKDIRFATPAEVKDKLGCIVGACYPLGSIASLATYLDKSLLSQPNISFSPGRHDKTIKLKTDDYLRIEKPQELDIAADV